MFEIHKNYVHNDIFHETPYLDTMQYHSKCHLTIFYKNICSNDNFLKFLLGNFKIGTELIAVAMETFILTQKLILNSDFTIIQPIMRAKNTVDNLDRIFPKMADHSYLVKIVLIIHHKCSQADITYNSVIRAHTEQWSRTNQQTNGWLTRSSLKCLLFVLRPKC